jgi:hypothetical protein
MSGRISQEARNISCGKRSQGDAGTLALDGGDQRTQRLVTLAGLGGGDDGRVRRAGQLGEAAEFLGAEQVRVVDDHHRRTFLRAR